MIELLWTTNEKSADYSFNKSHAACYALISYRTAYLKANYPAEYMAALISSVMSTKDKVPFYVSRCDEMGIEILPPDVNVSDHEFVVVEGNIRFGLDAVKGVGFQAVEAIKAARDEGGPFNSIWDFCERVDLRTVNKKTIDGLTKCGAFDSTGATRKGVLAVLDQAQGAGQKLQQDAAIGQGSIFDLAEVDGGSTKAAPRHAYPPIPPDEFEQSELLRLEKEAIGLFVSAHPLKEVKDALREKVDCSLSALDDKRDGESVCVGGMVAEARKIKTKRGDFMMFAQLADLEGTVELVVFGRSLDACEEALAGDSVVIVKGRVDHKDKSKTAVVVQDVSRFEPSNKVIEGARERAEARAEAEPTQGVETAFTFTVPVEALSEALIDDFKHILSNYPGDSEVVLQIASSQQQRAIKLGREFRVAASPGLRADVQALVGEEKLEAAA